MTDDREALVLTIHRELVRQVRGELIELVADDDLECEGALADAIIAAGFGRHSEPVKPSREDVARFLNPVAWKAYDAMMATHPDEPTNPVIVEDSLTKADEVLALWDRR